MGSPYDLFVCGVVECVEGMKYFFLQWKYLDILIMYEHAVQPFDIQCELFFDLTKLLYSSTFLPVDFSS